MFTVILKPKHGLIVWCDYLFFSTALLTAKRKSTDHGLKEIRIRHQKETIFTWRLQCTN